MERLDEIRVRLGGISDPVRLLQGIFAYAPFGLQVYRADGQCLLTNKSFRDLFGSEPPPDYNILNDDIAERQGLLGLVRRAFAGETVQTPTFWYDPRDLQRVHVTEGRRVSISITLLPLFGASGGVEHVALVFKDQTDETLARERAEAAQADAEGLAAQRAEQERWLQTVLDQMPTPLIFVEPGTARVFFSNAAAGRMAGGSPAHPQSAEDHPRLFDIRDLDDRPLRIDEVPVVRAARGEPVSGEQIRWYTPSGPKVITVHSARIPAMFGHPETVLIAFDDITPLKEVQAQLEEAVRVRQDFLSIAGHELKTPLTSVLLNLYAVDKSLHGDARAIDERLEARWQALRRQVGRLEGLVDQLLDVSRITAGKMTLAPEPIDLGALVREVAGRFSPEALAEPDAGTIDVQADSPVEGLWDRLRLEQILTNLLSNAVKYGAGRPIAVEVGAAGPGDDAEAWLAVRDRGIGMSEGELGRIFGRFERAVSERNYGGLGLGLWIVRQVVDAMGGSISVESQPDRGSTFTVRLPRRARGTSR
jgi:nitrogen fixation/metabolism regulation signal transduction histidine kinase